MLSNLSTYATIAVKDFARAKQFYEQKLGLKPFLDTPAGSMYEVGGGTKFFLFPTSSAGTAQNTVMGFATPDINSEVAELRSRGVVFEEYDFPGLKTVDSIATSDQGSAAWFKDSEGNILGLFQQR